MPNIQGVILIDVWEDPRLEDLYKDIVQRTAGFDIRCCVNATYNLDLRAVGQQSQDRSLVNTFQKHFWNRGIETQIPSAIAKHPSDRLIANVVRYSRSDSRSSDTLAIPDLLASSASVVILDYRDFVYHCDVYHNNSIRDWLVMGQAWGHCLHWRPMGLRALLKLTLSRGYNFYVTTWGVLDHNYNTVTEKCFDGTDGIVWEPVDDFGYRLVGWIADK